MVFYFLLGKFRIFFGYEIFASSAGGEQSNNCKPKKMHLTIYSLRQKEKQ